MTEKFLDYTVYGPYVAKDGRSRVILYKDKRKQTISYPKFLWWKEKGILISDAEEIHHKDEDYSNNKLDNFEVVLKKEHRMRHISPPEMVECKWCKYKFILVGGKLSNRKTNKKRGKVGPFCSRTCTGKYGSYIQGGMIGANGGGRKTNIRKLAEKLYDRRKGLRV